VPYFIETFDSPDRGHIRANHYQEHLDFLAENAALLLACGAKLDDAGEKASGGVYLVDVETRREADALIRQDPFYENGLFRKVQITRWRKAYLDGQSYLA